jgi:glycine/D-amino acid oxidase-like deaminating enzyme
MSVSGGAREKERPKQADVVVVGNGALGLFLTDELIERRIGSVVVVGPSSRDGGASQAAGAMLGCFGEVTAETLRTPAGRARFEIGVAAHDRWPGALDRLRDSAPPDQPLQVATDTHVVLNTVSAELDSVNFGAMTAALDAYNKPWSEIDSHDIQGYRPRPDCRALRAIHLPAEGAVAARGVLAALETRIRRAGVPIVDQTVCRLLSSNGLATGVELDDGTRIDAGITVVAAGARSEELVGTAAGDIELMPIFPGLGFAVIAKRLAGRPFRSVVRTPNRGFACGLHVVPCGNGREYLGATNRLVDEATSVAWLGDVRYLTQYSMQQLDEEIARHQIERFLQGNRPVTVDGFPLIGWLPVAGLYLLTGTYRDGFHCAPLLAAHVANELQGKPGIISPMFKPVREPIATRTMQQSIEEYVQHNLAAWFETGAEAAPQMTTAHLGNYYRALVTQLYDELGIDYALGPDLLWYAAGHMIGAHRIARYLRRHSGQGTKQAGAVVASIGAAEQ